MASTPAAPAAYWLAAATGVALLCGLAGCHRSWYRRDADKESSHLVKEHSTDPRWAFPQLSVYPDPRSRFFDPTDPDHSPMPQDDPAADDLMRCVAGMRGSKKWFKDGVRDEIENPAWREDLEQYLEMGEDGRFRLRLHDVVSLAYLHSPTYQSRVEDVYLTALDVAFERFRFDVQFFGGVDGVYTLNAKGRDVDPQGTRGVAFVPDPPPPPDQASRFVNHSAGLTIHKLFPTGAELLINFANSIVWQYAGTDSQQTLSFLNFNLIQPLLRLGGRDVVLERLTRVERGLLSNLRGLGRYRETFFTHLALGDEATGGPKRAGGFLGGAGLERGFSGIGVGGFGGAGEVTGFGRLGNGSLGGSGEAGSTGFVGGGAGLAGGYIGLAQLQQELQHREANLAHILREKARMEALFNANRIDRFQVEQFNQSVQTQLSQLLRSRSQLQSQVDAFLVNLGLPPDLPIRIDDCQVKQFEFFDPALTELDRGATAYMTRVRQLDKPPLPTVETAWQDGVKLHEAVSQQAAAVRQTFAEAMVKADERLQEHTEAERQELADDLKALGTTLTRVEKEIAQSGRQLQGLKGLLKDETIAPLVRGLAEFADALSEHVGDLSLVKARAGLEAIAVPAVELTPKEAFLIAREHRLDWMNQRAALVDQWRLIGFNADLLESDLNVIFSGDMATPLGDNMFDFRRQTGRLSVGVQFDAPLTRKAERNQYREAIINFQALRRSYIQYTDGVHQAVRHHLRTLAEARENLELQRKSFNIALRAFNLTRLKLREPPKDEKPSPTTARDLLGALSDLLGAQNNFMSVWIQYEAARMRLYRDLGIMEFDEHGAWVEQPLDPYKEAVQEALAPELASPESDDPVLPPPRPLPPADQKEE